MVGFQDLMDPVGGCPELLKQNLNLHTLPSSLCFDTGCVLTPAWHLLQCTHQKSSDVGGELKNELLKLGYLSILSVEEYIWSR